MAIRTTFDSSQPIVGTTGLAEVKGADQAVGPYLEAFDPAALARIADASNISMANAVAEILLNGDSQLSESLKGAPPAEREKVVSAVAETLEGQSIAAVQSMLDQIRKARG